MPEITWEEIAEMHKLASEMVAVTLFDGTTHEISAWSFTAIVSAAHPLPRP